MADRYDLLIANGFAFVGGTLGEADIGVRDGRIVAIGGLDRGAAAAVLDADGLVVLPGVIDSQVHFREPGLTHKEDLESGTRGAVLGGVTTVFEMPNTDPPTTDADALADKLARAKGRAWSDHAFFVGATAANADALPELETLPGCCGVKVFMGSSTGTLLVPDDETLRAVLSRIRRRAAFHCEDETLLDRRKVERDSGALGPMSVHLHPLWRDEEVALTATRRLLAASRRYGRKVHVLHVTTAQEMALLAEHKDLATVEVTPQHLSLAAPDCYDRLDTLAQMNPPVRGPEHREALWRAVQDGTVDVVGSDHAPHTLEEKAAGYPATPAGMTGVQTLVPVLLTHVAEGRISLERFVQLTSAGPQRVFGIARKGRIAVGYDADFTIVDLGRRQVIERGWIASKSGWSPFENVECQGWPIHTVIRGRIVVRDGELQDQPIGEPVRFVDTIPPVETG